MVLQYWSVTTSNWSCTMKSHFICEVLGFFILLGGCVLVWVFFVVVLVVLVCWGFLFLLATKLVDKYLTLLEDLGNFCVWSLPHLLKKTWMLQFSLFWEYNLLWINISQKLQLCVLEEEKVGGKKRSEEDIQRNLGIACSPHQTHENGKCTQFLIRELWQLISPHRKTEQYYGTR